MLAGSRDVLNPVARVGEARTRKSRGHMKTPNQLPVILALLPFCLGLSEPHKALELKLILKGSHRIHCDQPIPVRKLLHNGSPQPVAIVKPGDGSEVGWREPKFYYTCEARVGPHKWVAVNRPKGGRCGNFDANWQKDVVTLGAGQETDLGEWLATPDNYFELSPGTYRISLHYHYRAGAFSKGGATRGPTSVPTALENVPEFHLTSLPVEVEIIR